jgi:REP element-mobilizing transposase RayT
MNSGKTIFSQLMDFLSPYEFRKCVERYGGNYKVKSLTAREVLKRCPVVKKSLWGGEFWSDGYFATTVGRHGNENTLSDYVKRQGAKY